jgi:ribosomal protein S8
MGKSAPKPPDPEKTASAQTATNVNTAIANSFMGNVNQVTPDGSLTYSQTGTYKMTDPLSGKVYDLPTWTATQSLSDAQKAIKTQNDAASLNLSKLANTQSGRLNDLLSSPVNTGKLPAWGDPSKIANPNYAKFQNGPELQSRLGDTGQITTSYASDFSADRQKVEDALMARMNPQLQQDRAALEQRLANQGLQPGSEAYNRAVDEANRSASDARYGAILNAGQEQSRLVGLSRDAAMFGNDAQQQKFSQGLAGAEFGNSAKQQMYGNQNTATAANNALQDQGFNSQMAKTNAMNQQRQLQLQEAYAQRNQPINEISALLSGSQVSNPQFMNIQGQTMPTVDYAGIVANNHNQQMAAYNANQSNIGGLLGGLASIFTKSDDRTKKNKTRHGDVKGKMGVWSFNYKDEPAGTPRHVGLMASEVEKEVPSAIKRRNGIRYVNYEKALRGK